MDGKELFASLDGTRAHILVIVGLALTLLAPLIFNFRVASATSARAEFNQAGSMKDLDLEDFKRTQEEARKKYEETHRTSPDSSLPPEQMFEAMNKARQEREKFDSDQRQELTKKQEELDKKHDTNALKRAMLEAETGIAGSRLHMVVGWLGELLLLIGLLVMTVQSEGVRQKVLLAILLVVMFSALSGVSLDFLAQGRMGSSPVEIQRESRPVVRPPN